MLNSLKQPFIGFWTSVVIKRGRRDNPELYIKVGNEWSAVAKNFSR
jgi:hypothetical protein